MGKTGELGDSEVKEGIEQSQQAAAECLIACFGNPALFDLIQDGNKKRSKLVPLLEGFAKVCLDWEKVLSNPDSGYDTDSFWVSAMDVIKLCTRGLLTLLSVVPNHLGSSISDCNDLRKYNGSNLFMTRVRDTILETDFWTRLYDDLVSRGTASMKLAPELSLLTERLQASKVDEKTLAQAVARIPEMKKQMRAGACSDIDKVLYKKLVSLSKGVLNKEETDVTMGVLETLISGLGLYKSTEGVLQLLQKLEQYQKKECKALAACEIKFCIEEYPTSVDADMPEEGFAKPLAKLAEMCDQLETLTPSILSKLKLVSWWHFRELHGKAEEPADHTFQSRPYVSKLKDVLGRFTAEPDGKEPLPDGPETFDAAKLGWMNLSLDAFLLMKDFLTAAEDSKCKQSEGLDALLKIARMLLSLLTKIEKYEGDRVFGSGPDSVPTVLQWSWLDKGHNMVRESLALTDGAEIRSAALKEELQQTILQLHTVTRKMHLPHSGDSWKADLNSDSTIQDVIAAAQMEDSLGSLDGGEVDGALTRLEQVLQKAKRFGQQLDGLEHLERRCDLFNTIVPEAHQEMKLARAVKVEGLLCMALETLLQKGAAASTVAWAKDIVRSQLGDVSGGRVSEEDIHPALLPKAREFIRQPQSG